MAKFLFSYRMSRDYTPGRPEMVTAWKTWFQGMGGSLLELGNPVFESSTLGNCGSQTQLGGYSIIEADDLQAAEAIGKGCPALDADGGVEVGVITELDVTSRPAVASRPASEG